MYCKHSMLLEIGPQNELVFAENKRTRGAYSSDATGLFVGGCGRGDGKFASGGPTPDPWHPTPDP
jgi:hypothetical protein